MSPRQIRSVIGFLLLLCLCLVGTTGCGSSDTSGGGDDGDQLARIEVEFPEGDPSVPAELGGPGFTGEGWETAAPEPMGDPRAVKGGAMI